MKYYQPVPLPGFDGITFSRTNEDCEGRFLAIKNNYGDFTKKTLLDLCCANGYFLIRFLQNGGIRGVGIDNDPSNVGFINGIADDFGLNCYAFDSIDKVHGAKFDVGIYLDTHYHDGTEGYLEFMRENVKVLYTSSSRSSQDYRALLKTMFSKVDFVYDEKYADRLMYRCE